MKNKDVLELIKIFKGFKEDSKNTNIKITRTNRAMLFLSILMVTLTILNISIIFYQINENDKQTKINNEILKTIANTSDIIADYQRATVVGTGEVIGNLEEIKRRLPEEITGRIVEEESEGYEEFAQTQTNFLFIWIFIAIILLLFTIINYLRSVSKNKK